MVKALKSNWQYKLLAVIITFLIFMYTYGRQNPVERRGYDVGLQVYGCPEGMIVSGLPQRVSITVSGRREDLAGLKAGDIRAFVSLGGKGAGRHRVSVNYLVPGGFKVVEVNPGKVNVRLEELMSKLMKVGWALYGLGEFGEGVPTPRIEPAEVKVSGPRGKVEKVAEALVFIDLREVELPLEGQFAVQLFDIEYGKIAGLVVEPRAVLVKIPVGIRLASKSVPVKVEVVGNLADGFKVDGIEVEPALVELRGEAEGLHGIKELVTEPINVGGARRDVRKEVRVRVPSGVSLVGSGIVKVRVKVVGE